MSDTKTKTAKATTLKMYGHSLTKITQAVLAYLRKAGKASRPDIANAVLVADDKAPGWAKGLETNQRFRIVRKVLEHLVSAGKVTSRKGKSIRGNAAHLFSLAK